MTAASEVIKPRRSRGFTIASIIGTDSDGQTDGQDKSTENTENDHNCAKIRRTSHNISGRDSDSDYDVNSDSERKNRDSAHSNLIYQHERLRPKENIAHGDLDSSMVRRTSNSLHRDSVRDFNFSSVNVREGIRSVSSPDALRHLHESFIQTAGLSPASGPVPVTHLEAQRHFRHPLAAAAAAHMGGGFPGQVPMGPQVHPAMLMNGGRDMRHMYPYIADRYPGCFLPRYGMGGMPGLFFQPYRKPKRIRTAFSPSQLLQLEKSFEKSHYVVGQERKDLANELQLTETQVKVWFQNRRTKYKRTKSEGEGGGSSEGHDPKSPFDDSKSGSDISDIDDIDDVGEEYSNAHAYHHAIQTC